MSQEGKCPGCPGWDHIVDVVEEIAEVANVVLIGPEDEDGLILFDFKLDGLSERVRDEMAGTVDMATKMSGRTCQKCGAPGKVREFDDGYMTLCRCHYNQERINRILEGSDE